jgi:P-type E1-E2 ATPase
MNVAAAFSQRRLRKQGVSSNNLSKIIENGRINMICFDKTGTLTRKDVQFEGYLPNRQGIPFRNQQLIGNENRHKFFELESKHK